MVSPPETLIVWPVMKSASSLARNSTAPALHASLLVRASFAHFGALRLRIRS
jgi:hypothetical protein